MDVKKVVADTIKESEKQKQEVEVAKIKQIVQLHLEKLDKLTDERKELDKKIGVLKKDLDDMKAGRLDKIEERQQKDPTTRGVSIIFVKRIEKEYLPAYPWRSPWQVELVAPTYTTALGGVTTTGSNFTNFTSGTYTVGDHVINL